MEMDGSAHSHSSSGSFVTKPVSKASLYRSRVDLDLPQKAYVSRLFVPIGKWISGFPH